MRKYYNDCVAFHPLEVNSTWASLSTIVGTLKSPKALGSKCENMKRSWKKTLSCQRTVRLIMQRGDIFRLSVDNEYDLRPNTGHCNGWHNREAISAVNLCRELVIDTFYIQHRDLSFTVLILDRVVMIALLFDFLLTSAVIHCSHSGDTNPLHKSISRQ